MKKRILSKAAVFAVAAALALPATVSAAAPATTPIEVSVKQDGKTHKVFVFGQSLALVSTDGSIEISTMGPVGRVDVMIDGVLTKNVSSIDIPANQQTNMVLDENSIIVKNVTAESGEAIKSQISSAYASGASSIDLASLGNVAAYKINADGQIVNANGNTVSSNAIGLSVASTDNASAAFSAELRAIEAAASEAAAAEASAAEPAVVSSDSRVSSSSVGSGSGTVTPGEGEEGEGEGGGGTTTDPTTPTDPEEGGEDDKDDENKSEGENTDGESTTTPSTGSGQGNSEDTTTDTTQE